VGAIKTILVPALVATAVTILVLRFVRPAREFALSSN